MNLGRYGESLACRFLTKKGYIILTRNYYTNFGEVDIIANHRDVLVFVEVKTRIGIESGYPYEAITPKKLMTIRRVGRFYLQGVKENFESLRIDVVSVILQSDYQVKSIDHFENVF